MKSILIFAIGILLFKASYSQSTLRGKVTDENGEAIVGATIYLRSTPTTGTISDLDGNYTLRIQGSVPQAVVFSYISYKTVEDTITPLNGQVVLLNVSMVPVSLELNDVVIVAKAKKANDSYMKVKKMNSSVTLDYISKETIKKTGDSHIDDAIKRVTGVSTAGGYITVRGLADRYIKTTINGSRIPTLDPLSNNIKLDMFPTSLVDNIVINKSGSPDLPGDWAGSYLSIETRDYPEKLIVNIKTSFGYNDQSSFREIVSSEKSSTDWLGYDNGFRDIKNYTKENYPYYIENTSPYDEFTELGLSGYLKELGITEKNLPDPQFPDKYYFSNNMYYRLGLVELGLLIPGFINDDESVKVAIDEYYRRPEFKDKAHFGINRESAAYGASLPDNWFTSSRKTIMDFSQDFNIGNQINFLGRPLGFIAGFRYSSAVRNDPSTVKTTGIFSTTGSGEFFTNSTYNRQKSSEINQWSALLNIAYKLSPNHNISFLFMPNIYGAGSTNVDSGYNKVAYASYGFSSEYFHRQYYEERKQLIYQAQTSHFFPVTKMRVEFNASYTNGISNTPDFKTLNYGLTELGVYGFRQAARPERNYRYLTDDILDSRVTAELPFFEKTGLPRKIKAGAAFLSNTRESEQYSYKMYGGFEQALLFKNTGEIREYIARDKFLLFDTLNHTLFHYYIPQFLTTDFSKGYSRVSSAFILLDYTIIPTLRLAGGLRLENTSIYTDVTELFNKDVPAFDPVRQAELPGFSKALYANPGIRDELHYLPSINLIYKIVNTGKVTLNTRLSYNQSIGRPSIREISGYIDYNYEVDNYVIGNPDLKMVEVKNYDIRLESYFQSGDNLSLSLFLKQFENHIEFANESSNFTWRNAPGESNALGIEVEGKKQILSNFEIMGNITLIDSKAIVKEVINGIVIDTTSRTMYGQSPYIVNGIITYKSEKAGLSATLSYNVQGPKLIFVTITEEQPDVYELPRHFLDFKISKSLGKHFGTELKIRDILKTRVSWAYDYNDFEIEYEGYRYGTSYTLSFYYDF